jgi:predicted hydrocarbon binding protein
MSKKEIPLAAIQRSQVWIEAVTKSLGNCENKKFAKETMKKAGKSCAMQLLEKTIEYYGKRPANVYELVEAINKRRKEVLHVTNFWTIEGNQAHFRLNECGCDLVQSGLATPNKTFCLCSAGMFENLFQPFCKDTVKVELKKAIGFGDECCEFVVNFNKQVMFFHYKNK